MITEPASVYLCLGTNLGDRRANLEKALEILEQRVRLAEKSSIYDTEPEDCPSQPRFLNMVCHAYTHLEPNELLILLKGIEAKIGRAPGGHLAPRLIDIDILFYDNIIMHSSNLTIPHPGIVQRDFVLVPLAEIAPELEHPENHSKIKDLLGALKKGVQGVFKFTESCPDKNNDPGSHKGE
jgi:2-amino-4-hydroxy-6-hydroxymethyldihydropteridine diphosphokinase